MSLEKTKAISNQNNKWENISAQLKTLGASLMFPLLLLAFASLVLGITYLFPSEWITTQAASKIAMSIFNSFSYLVFFSLIITFHKDKDNTTMINAALFLFVLVAVQQLLDSTTDIDSYYFTNSVFSMILCSIVFITVDKIIWKPWLWVGVGFLFTLVLIPIFAVIALLIKDIGFLIGKCPYGINAFLYGTVNRLLLPFGLHSLLIPTFTYTAVGGSLEITDSLGEVTTINGDSAIWTYLYTHEIGFQSLSGTFNYEGLDYSYELINTNSPGQYQVGFLPVTTFILPIMAIGYTLINGWQKGRLLLFSSLITLTSGLTEVTEYLYLYTNIYLYLLEVLAVGISFMLCNILDVTVWISTGWALDIILFGIIPSMNGFVTHWYWIPVIGISIGTIFVILFNLVDKMSKTPISV